MTHLLQPFIENDWESNQGLSAYNHADKTKWPALCFLPLQKPQEQHTNGLVQYSPLDWSARDVDQTLRPLYK